MLLQGFLFYFSIFNWRLPQTVTATYFVMKYFAAKPKDASEKFCKALSVYRLGDFFS